MSDKIESHRVLLCIGVNQNFMDSPKEEAMQVWEAFASMLQGIEKLPGTKVLGIMDDDVFMVGPSPTAPWTAYIMADMTDIEIVRDACNFVRTTLVGDGTYKLWKYMRVEARIGRELVVPA